MRTVDLIEKKKQGKELTKEELSFLIDGYLDGSIPDYQMSAFLMAVCFQGLSIKETSALTFKMRDSGEVLDLSGIPGRVIDKHSTGGVGDKVSLVLSPLMAACGVSVAKMSGRGLGNTGGTIDKLESIPGFQTKLERDEFIRNVKETGIALAGAAADLAPADKRLYALRDVTATVDSIPLIASSILSKKLASGAEGIVLDVKFGSGAFMKYREDAIKLAQTMVELGREAGKEVTAILTAMEQPLGHAVGNALEVKETIGSLSGNGPEDLMEVVFALGAEMIRMAGLAENEEEAVRKMEDAISSGAAKKKLAEFIRSQGGDDACVDDPDLLPAASLQCTVCAEEDGFIQAISAECIGHACMTLGAGRQKKGDAVDPAVGVIVERKCGEPVKKGDVLFTIHANDEARARAAEEECKKAVRIGEEEPRVPKMVWEKIRTEQ